MPKQPSVQSQSVSQYVIATLATALLTGLVSFYLWLQFGYFDRFLFNRSLAEASLLGLVLVLFIGPLARLFDVFDHWLLYRKELGVLSFILATAHFLISGLGLPGRSWLGFLGRNPQSFWTGVIALAIFAVLFIFSFETTTRLLPRKLWWAGQNWGVRLAGLLVIGHLFFLRQSSWLGWWQNGGTVEMMRPWLPPITVVTGTVVLAVLLTRLVELLGPKTARLLTQMLLLTTVGALGFAVWHSYKKTPRPLPLTWEVCQRLPAAHIQESYPAVCVAPGNRRVTQPTGEQ